MMDRALGNGVNSCRNRLSKVLVNMQSQHFLGVFLHFVKLHDMHSLQEYSQQSNIYKYGTTAIQRQILGGSRYVGLLEQEHGKNVFAKSDELY